MILNKGKLKTLAIFLLILFFAFVSLGQNSEEEKLRIKFSKSLDKKRWRESSEKDKSVKLVDNKEIANKTEDDGEIISVKTELVRADVLVFDDKGNAVLGLKPEDFTLTENKVEQKIEAFDLGDTATIPKTIVLIIDYSGSQEPYIKTSVAAAKVLIDKLNPQDRMAIVSDDVELLTDFTRDKTLMKAALDKLQRKSGSGKLGKSLQYSALYAVIKEMFDEEDIRPIIVFQTDGDQLFNLRRENAPMDAFNPSQTSFSDREMLDTIERSKVTVYSVISGDSLLGLERERQIEKITPYLLKRNPKLFKTFPEQIPSYADTIFRMQTTMTTVAKISGGFHEKLETPEQADKIYENILKGIENRYLLGYYPSDDKRSGKRRIVSVTVKNHPEYKILGRRFYFPLEAKSEKAK